MTANNADIPLRAILENPELSCEQRWGKSPAATERLASLKIHIDNFQNLKSQIKQKKAEKQICARDFGKVKSENLDTAALKAEMQKISSELGSCEKQLKEIEDLLLSLFAADSTQTRRLFPERFDATSDSTDVEVNVTSVDANDTAWDDYVSKHPQASIYHAYTWREVIEKSFGHDGLYLIARDTHGKTRGILPLTRLRSRLFGDFAVSVPFFNYGGALADSNQISQQLMDHAARWANQQGIDHVEIRSTQPVSEWLTRTDKVSMIRVLPATEELLEAELGSKIRAQINRARNENPDVLIGHNELLDDFYRVFAINMRDLGTPVYSKKFFRNILDTFPQQSHIVIVRHRGKAVAAAFLLGHREMMEIPWASTLQSVNHLNINMLMYRHILGFSIRNGYGFFDFGRSTIDAGTFRFKKQWGAQPAQHYWQYWLRDGGELPGLKPDNPKFQLAIKCWKRLPVFVTKLIGPHIVKNLP